MSEDTPAPDPEGMAAAMRAAQEAAEAERAAEEKAAADALAASLAAMQAANADAKPAVIPMPVEIFARINPATLAEALRLAGLPGNCSADRVTLPMDASAETIAAVRALVAAHKPDAPPPVNLADYAQAAHAALRDGGVTVGGMRIKTDSESRGLIDGAYALSTAQPDSPIDFKTAGGWVTIDAAMMQTVAVAVGRWVQACYTAYRAVDGKIGAGTITAPAQVDAAFAAVTLPG